MEKKFGYKIAIFDPSSIYGKEMKRVLVEKEFPIESVKLIGSEEMMGTLTDFDDEATFIQLADNNMLEESDVVFFCGNAEETRKLASLHNKLDFFAFDLSRSMTESDQYRLFVDGVNSNEAPDFKGIYASPNPNSVLLSKVLHKLDKTFGVESAAATVITSVSEFGFDGIKGLHKQTADLLSFASLSERQKIFNIFPSAVSYPAETANIAKEVEKLVPLKAGTVSLSVFEAPIFYGSAASVYIELKKEPGVDFLWKKIFLEKEGFHFEGDVSKGDLPVGPVEIAETDLLHVQILSRNEENGKKLWMWVLADNIRLCAVINMLRIAEKALRLS